MAGVVWKLLKTAAGNIPWGRMVQNAPAVVDLVERVRERLAAGPHGVHEELEAIREENIKLADSLLQTSAQVEDLRKALEVVIARQKMVAGIAVVSLLAALISLVGWLVK